MSSTNNPSKRLSFNNRKPIEWRIDDDGYLRVTICVLKEGVYDYGCEETPQAADLPPLRGLDTIREYIPEDELCNEAAIKSLEGKDIVVGNHEWQTPENYDVANIAGAVAGTPYVKDGELLCDAIIKCPDTIKNITSDRTPADERYVEVSAGYDGELIAESGTYNGEQYDARQTNFCFNHILLLPCGKGRCGTDVRIKNTKQEEGVRMPYTLKVRIGNADRTFRFSNEDDAKEAEKMVEEERTFNAEAVTAALSEKADLSKQLDDLKAQLATHDETLRKAKEELEAAMSEDTQEILAAEMAEQSSDEEAIANAETAELADGGEITNEEDAEEKTEEFLNSVRKNKDGSRVSMSVRRANMVRAVMERQGMKIPKAWEQTAFDAAFETLVVKARHANKRREEQAEKTQQRVTNGKPTPGKAVSYEQDNRTRMLNAMRLRKGGKKDE